jgi:lysophospholipase L1-like esterase
MEPYQMKKPDDTLRIAYIGDSWAFLHKDHDIRLETLLEDTLHRPVKVYSHGICGLTSKEIYEKMFNDTVFHSFLKSEGYQYCFISAGINDTYKKMSTSYYQQSMDGIIQFLLTNNIHPIILEIPDYDIQKAYYWQKSFRKVLRDISMFINNTTVDCKQMYRDALNEHINKKGYQNKVSIIRYESWNGNYDKDLQQLYLGDGMHLNSVGYVALDSIIAKTIIDNLNK